MITTLAADFAFLPIVGMFHRKPAMTIVRFLATGTPLVLRREPSNPYDANAIQVHVRLTSVTSHLALVKELFRLGYEYDAFPGSDETLMLGFIDSKNGFAPALVSAGFPLADVPATFMVLSDNKPAARLQHRDWRQ